MKYMLLAPLGLAPPCMTRPGPGSVPKLCSIFVSFYVHWNSKSICAIAEVTVTTVLGAEEH